MFCNKGICDIKGMKSPQFANIQRVKKKKRETVGTHKYVSWALGR